MRYVPIMRTKAGELTAMQHLGSAAIQQMLPLLELNNIQWSEDDLQEKPDKLAGRLKTAWPWDTLVLLDCSILDGNQRNLTAALQSCRSAGLNFIPTLTINRSQKYYTTVIQDALSAGLGIGLRLPVNAETADFATTTRQMMALHALPPEQVDMVVDLGASQAMPPAYAPWLAGLINATPDVARFRTFAIAGTTFPRNMSEFPAGQIRHASRGEWALWRNIIGIRGLARPIDFGDYTAAYPEDVDFDPKKMRMGAKIKYTVEESWLIVKGRGIKTRGFEQYRGLCRSLMQQPEYKGAAFSWGDRFIDNCANGTGGPGNAQTWVTVAVNHHLAFVADQLSRWSAP